MTAPFDWAGLRDELAKALRHADPDFRMDADTVLAFLRPHIEAAFVPVERYDQRGEAFISASKLLLEATARAESAEARVKALETTGRKAMRAYWYRDVPDYLDDLMGDFYLALGD